jgi:CheY-like chemotaxis protein
MSPAPAGPPPGDRRPSISGTNPLAPTILIVEDDPDFRYAISQIVRDEGYRVETAPDGRAALDKLRWGLRPRLILLDLRMGIMNGWDFRAEQKKDPALAGIPVVAMTAGRWKQGDLDDFTARTEKPIDLDQLRAILDQHRSGKGGV